MVAWARVVMLCGVTLACGGRAQRTNVDDEANAGGSSSAGAPNEVGAGTGGTSQGVGGTAGTSVIPNAGSGGAAGASMASGGTATWTGVEGPPGGEPSGTHECPQGTTTEYLGELPDVGLRFRGMLNGESVELTADRMSTIGGCSGDIWTVELFFDGAFAGDRLTLYFDAREGCLVQAWYLPQGAAAEAATIQSDLHLWNLTQPDPAAVLPNQFVYGAVAIRALAVDGSVTHELDGELTIQLAPVICIG